MNHARSKSVTLLLTALLVGPGACSDDGTATDATFEDGGVDLVDSDASGGEADLTRDAGGADAGGADTGQPDAPLPQLPAGLLDLQDWKLTLPIGDEEDPQEIEQPELASYEIVPYFHLNAAHDGVVFRAHCGGVTTSGSGYPRSELREMKNGGADKASWSTSSGVHTMFIEQAITHLPPEKPHVVAGQIHDADDDVIVIRLEGETLFIDLNGDDGPTLDDDYQLGTVFTVRFVAEGGTIRIYYNGSASPAIEYDKSTSGCYFKAGCYTQSNTDKGDEPDAYGEVEIYELWVTHS